MHPSLFAALVFIGVFAFLTLGMTYLAYGALKRTGNPKLRFLPVAFSLFFVKGIIVAFFINAANQGSVQSALEHAILTSAAIDLAILALLVAPFLMRSQPAPES